MEFLDRLGAALKSRQLELTGPRRKVAETVGSYKKHFEAEDLQKEILRRKIKVSRATIYRTLDLLVATGLLRKIILPSRSARYEISEGRTHHAHIVCKRCKRIIEVASPEIDELIARLCRSHGLVDYEVTFEIAGVCNGEGK